MSGQDDGCTLGFALLPLYNTGRVIFFFRGGPFLFFWSGFLWPPFHSTGLEDSAGCVTFATRQYHQRPEHEWPCCACDAFPPWMIDRARNKWLQLQKGAAMSGNAQAVDDHRSGARAWVPPGPTTPEKSEGWLDNGHWSENPGVRRPQSYEMSPNDMWHQS